MITKHIVSNDIAIRGETDAAPHLICLREKENTFHKGTEARSSYRTNSGVMFDAPPPTWPVHAKTNRKTIKRMTSVYPLLLRCCHLPSPGGLTGFTLACPVPPKSTVAPAPSPETMGRRRIRRTPFPYQIMVVSPWSPRCWNLPSSGGGGGFFFG